MPYDVPPAWTRWNEIVPGLYQGGHDTIDADVIVGSEFGLVVSLYERPGHGPDEGVEHVVVKVPDGELTAEQMAEVNAVVPRIVATVKAGTKVLVRCQAGYNRSGLVVALALLAMGYTADEAITQIRRYRSPYALCNAHFVQYIQAAAVNAPEFVHFDADEVRRYLTTTEYAPGAPWTEVVADWNDKQGDPLDFNRDVEKLLYKILEAKAGLVVGELGDSGGCLTIEHTGDNDGMDGGFILLINLAGQQLTLAAPRFAPGDLACGFRGMDAAVEALRDIARAANDTYRRFLTAATEATR